MAIIFKILPIEHSCPDHTSNKITLKGVREQKVSKDLPREEISVLNRKGPDEDLQLFGSYLYMNDLPKCIKDSHITMYAYDTIASRAVKTLDDIRISVVPNLHSISDWVKANKLSLNAIKTEFMVLGTT